MPGRLERYDWECHRNSTVNLFVAVDAHRPWRKVTLTRRCTAVDFAAQMPDLVEVGFPDADKIRVVMDNLSTHTPGALYEAFPAPEAHGVSAGWSSTSRRSTPAGSAWLSSRSAS